MCALIIPNIEVLKKKLVDDDKSKLLDYKDKKLLENLEVRRYFCDILHEVNKNVPPKEKVERFALIENKENFLEVDKFRQRILQNNKHLIDHFYQEIPPGIG
jgi:long-subunit acyl-CoA synthetase (AMP-forming)